VPIPWLNTLQGGFGRLCRGFDVGCWMFRSAFSMFEVQGSGFERGRYDSAIDYAEPPQVPLPEEEAAWAGETLFAKGA
jgi:hypothetical protein